MTTAQLQFTHDGNSYSLELAPSGFILSQAIAPDRLTAWAACIALRDSGIHPSLKPALRPAVERLVLAAMACDDPSAARVTAMVDAVLGG